MLDESFGVRGDSSRHQGGCDLNSSHRLHDMRGCSETDGAMSLAVVATCFVYVGSERIAGQQNDKRQHQHQELGALLAGYGLHVHLERLDVPSADVVK